MLKLFYFKQFSLGYIHSLVLFDPLIGLSGATSPGQNEHGSDDNKRVLHIPQSSRINEALRSDCLVSHTGYSLKGSYSPAEMQLMYSTAPTDWANAGL